MKLLFASLTLVFSLFAMADQQQTFGKYQVHYNTFESTFLTPAIANQYGFSRSKRLGLLNVAVLKTQLGSTPKPTPAIVTGTVTNLIGQIVKLQFVTIDEGEAIYYIAPFSKTNDEILRFKVSAKLNANLPPMEVTFQKHLYVDK